MSENEKFQQHLTVLSMRAQNVNLAFNDFLREVSTLSKAYADKIAELEKENAELKAKPKETQKTR